MFEDKGIEQLIADRDKMKEGTIEAFANQPPMAKLALYALILSLTSGKKSLKDFTDAPTWSPKLDKIISDLAAYAFADLVTEVSKLHQEKQKEAESN